MTDTITPSVTPLTGPPATAAAGAAPTAPTFVASAPSTAGPNRWYLSQAPILRALVHLCVPVAAGESIGALYNLVNGEFIGSLHDTALLAAITFGLPMVALMLAVGGVFGTGAGALIARLLGASEQVPDDAGHRADIKHASSFAFWGSLLSGAAVGVTGLVLLRPIVAVLGATGAAARPTRLYCAVLLAFLPVLAANFCLEQLVRAQGAARQSMIGLLVSTGVNLVCDVAFILVLGWGVVGAGLAFGLAGASSAAYYVWFLQRHGDGLSLAPRWLTVQASVVKPVLGVGAGALLQAGFMIVMSLVLNNVAAAYGDAPLAAFGVSMRVMQLPQFIVMGVSTGVMPLLAYSYGKGDADRLRAGMRAASLTVAAVVVPFFVGVLALRRAILGTFTDQPQLIALGTLVLTAQLVTMLAQGCSGLVATLFQSTGRGLASIVLLVGPGLLFVPAVLLGRLWYGLDGVIWAETVAEGVGAVLAVGLWALTRASIAHGLAEGSPERAEQALAAAES